MRWLEKATRYRGSDLERTARDRGVVGVVADRAQVYCLDCAAERDLVVIGEIYPGSQQFEDNLCDGCNQHLATDSPLMGPVNRAEA